MERLILPIPPSVNGLYKPSGRGVYKSRAAIRWQKDVAILASSWRNRTRWIPTTERKVIANIWTYWPDNKIHDTHNLYKVLFDGLEGILYDNDFWVIVRQQDFSVDSDNPRVEIALELFTAEVPI